MKVILHIGYYCAQSTKRNCQRGASATLSVQTEEEKAFLIAFVEGDMIQDQHFISLMYGGSEFQQDRGRKRILSSSSDPVCWATLSSLTALDFQEKERINCRAFLLPCASPPAQYLADGAALWRNEHSASSELPWIPVAPAAESWLLHCACMQASPGKRDGPTLRRSGLEAYFLVCYSLSSSAIGMNSYLIAPSEFAC